MQISALYKFITGFFVASIIIVSQAREADELWRLRVMDTEHQVKVDATIGFTSVAAKSCMGGSK
jgi:hypothetical protein